MKDDCRVIGHELLEYVYGDLDEARKRRVDRHLSDCPRCSGDLRSYQETLALIDESTLDPSEELSEHFAGVVVAILSRRASDRRLPALRAFATASLGLFLVANSYRLSVEGLPHIESETRELSIPAYVAELDDPLVEKIALRNLSLSARIGRTL